MCFRKTRIDQPGPSQARSDKTRPNRTGPNPDPCRIPAALRRVSRSPPLTHAARRLLMCRAVTGHGRRRRRQRAWPVCSHTAVRLGPAGGPASLASTSCISPASPSLTESETGRVGPNMSQSQAGKAQAGTETAREGQRRTRVTGGRRFSASD